MVYAPFDMSRKERREEKFTFKRKPPKYKVGDLVMNGKAIVIRIHEKADYNKPFYLVHDIVSMQEEWIAENLIEVS
jgi:hypothetical protein